MAIITPAEARVLIPGLTGTAEDATLDVLIARAGQMMAMWCGYPRASATSAPTMESTTYVLDLDGPGGRDLVVPVWPLTAVTSIYDDPAGDFGADTLVDAADYAILDGTRGVVRLRSTSVHGAWSTGSRTIRVTCTAGYTAPDAALQHACAMVVKHLWSLRRVQGAVSASQGGASTAREDAALLPREAVDALWPYVLPSRLLGGYGGYGGAT